MTGLYLESSAVLRAVLDGDERAREALARADELYASELTFVESARALVRLRRVDGWTRRRAEKAAVALAQIEGRCEALRLDAELLRAARGELPVEPVRTLDAIHLATIQLLHRELGEIAVATYDRRIRANLDALGIPLAAGLDA